MATKVWIVGQRVDPRDSGVWCFCGVYSTEEAARGRCMDDTFFIGPATIDGAVPIERVAWPDVYNYDGEKVLGQEAR